MRILRPSVLITLSVLVVAGILVWRPAADLGQPAAAPVGPHDLEVAWLYPATSVASWDRFVASVTRGRDALADDFPDLEVEAGGAFPRQTTAVPEVALTWTARKENGREDSQGGVRRRLLFRWYKLTGSWRAGPWVHTLLDGRPAPVAIIGGNNSYWARELALALRAATEPLPPASRPVLLLTTATADRVPAPPGEFTDPAPSADDGPPGEATPPAGAVGQSPAGLAALTDLYPGRTFRGCFTNRQMATAVTRFIWSRDDLRPDLDPVYTVQWQDDAYSQDLVDGYHKALSYRVLETHAGQWAWVSGCVAAAGVPPFTGGAFPLVQAGRAGTGITLEGLDTLLVDSSVGSVAGPNVYEARAVQLLLEQVQAHGPPGEAAGELAAPGVFPMAPMTSALPAPGVARPGQVAVAGLNAGAGQRRPLLVVSGQSTPSRRLLRDLARSAPQASSRFVVAMGDALSFNTVYRDRLATWPVQDLPFALVFFAHGNPIDPQAGFTPLGKLGYPAPGADPSAQSGTEDLLHNQLLVEALVRAVGPDGAARDGERLAGRLTLLTLQAGRPRQLGDQGSQGDRGARLAVGGEGVPLFRPSATGGGQRNSSSGEHVVYLRPRVTDGRVLPEALIEVWSWQRPAGQERAWRPVGTPLRVRYEEPVTLGDD